MPQPSPADATASCAQLLSDALEAAWPQAAQAAVVLERPKDARHRDYACNVAMQLPRQLTPSPREIAQAIVKSLPASPIIEKAEVAGAGFINLFLKLSFKQRFVNTVLAAAEAYGRSAIGQRKKLQVEFVSANPT